MQLCPYQHSSNMGTTTKLMTSIDCSGPNLIWARDHQSWKSAAKSNHCTVYTLIIFVNSIFTPRKRYPKPIMNKHNQACCQLPSDREKA